MRAGSREEALADETDRIVARRGRTSIVRTQHGLVMAAAGRRRLQHRRRAPWCCCPLDPDASARRLREALAPSHRAQRRRAGDRHRRPGLARSARPTSRSAPPGSRCCTTTPGGTDPHGNELAVTAPAVADELAAAADLVKRKLDRRPAAVVRGLAGLVLGRASTARRRRAGPRRVAGHVRPRRPRGGAARAARRRPARLRRARAPAVELVAHLSPLLGGTHRRPAGGQRGSGRDRRGSAGASGERGAADARLRAAAFALGWQADRPATPVGGRQALLRFRPALRRLAGPTHSPAPTSRRPRTHGQAEQGPGPRAVVEQMRRDQQRAERRRTIVVISACLVVGLVIIGARRRPAAQAEQDASGSRWPTSGASSRRPAARTS